MDSAIFRCDHLTALFCQDISYNESVDCVLGAVNDRVQIGSRYYLLEFAFRTYHAPFHNTSALRMPERVKLVPCSRTVDSQDNVVFCQIC